VLQRDDHDRPLTMLITAVREVQIPLLAAMLLGGSITKLVRAPRAATAAAGLGPTALFPMNLRRPIAALMSVIELALGVGLIVTAGRIGSGRPATAVRLATALFFIVATCALMELRTTRPDLGCGCFGNLSQTPVSGRALARSVLLAAAALTIIGLPPLHQPHPSAAAARLLAIFVLELVVIAALSPEVGESLVRLGYSEPCELRMLSPERTLAALRRSSQWRKRCGLITADAPVDVWRELCWRYVVYPARADGRAAELVFAVYLRRRRPVIQASLVDARTGDVLPWPAVQRRLPAPWRAARRGGAARRTGPRRAHLRRPGIRSPVLASPTDPGLGIPAIPGAPAASTGPLRRAAPPAPPPDGG
jgi:Methylamine utilisation protein MauE